MLNVINVLNVVNPLISQTSHRGQIHHNFVCFVTHSIQLPQKSDLLNKGHPSFTQCTILGHAAVQMSKSPTTIYKKYGKKASSE